MNKQKKKLPLAMQIFIALILAIVVGFRVMQHLRKIILNHLERFSSIY